MNSADLTPRRPPNGNLYEDSYAPMTFIRSDLYEKESNFVVEMDIPGVTREDINIDFQNGFLIVSGGKKEIKEEEGRNYIRRERYSNQFNRQFYLGNANPDDIKAEYKEGILKIIVPRTDGVSNKSRIPIE